MPVRLERIRWMCAAGALSVLLLVSSNPFAFCQVNDNADAPPEDVTGQPQENALRPGLIQPRDIPPEMQITNELLTEAKETAIHRSLMKRKGPFENALNSSNLSDEEKKAIDEGAKYWVYRYSMKKYREEEAPPKTGEKAGTPPKNPPPKERLHTLTKTMINDIRLKVKTPAAREYLLKAITDRSAELLDNHLHVRLNIVYLLGTLSSEHPAKLGVEPPAYVGAYPVLLKVVTDNKQHQAIKIAAVVGLTRICRTALPDPNDKRRAEMALALAAELKRAETHWWYQMRLLECLAITGVTVDPAARNNPVVLDALRETISDKKRTWEMRTLAAKTVGRLPLDNSIIIAPTTYAIVQLGYEMAQAYNADPKRVEHVEWKLYFFEGLFFAFKAESATEQVAWGKRKPGLMEMLPNSKDVREAYEQIVLMTNHVLDSDGKRFSKDQLKGFEDWLQSRKPAKAEPAGDAPVGANPKTESAPQTKPVSTEPVPQTKPASTGSGE